MSDQVERTGQGDQYEVLASERDRASSEHAAYADRLADEVWANSQRPVTDSSYQGR